MCAGHAFVWVGGCVGQGEDRSFRSLDERGAVVGSFDFPLIGGAEQPEFFPVGPVSQRLPAFILQKFFATGSVEEYFAVDAVTQLFAIVVSQFEPSRYLASVYQQFGEIVRAEFFSVEYEERDAAVHADDKPKSFSFVERVAIDEDVSHVTESEPNVYLFSKYSQYAYSQLAVVFRGAK